MSASMASVSMRKAASPSNIAGVFKSPQVRHTLGHLGAVLHPATEEPWSPHSVLTLKGSPRLSPHVGNTLSPYLGVRSPLQSKTLAPSRVGKCSRKLPWSDGGKHSTALKPRSSPNTLLGGVHQCSHILPSADTPDRPEMLESFKVKNADIHIIGKGSFGSVIEAIYKDKAVAVKIIQSSPEAYRQIQNEKHSLNLKHSNIVSVVKVTSPVNGFAGVVIMERVTGCSLQNLLDHDLLCDKIYQRVKYSMQISCALAYCHERGILHLDVKPQNVLIDMLSDSCKLCDFGCSSKSDAEFHSLQGTVGYAAPEILQGNKPTSAADVYSLGITMWQLMSGEAPYKDLRGHTVIYRVVAAEYRPQLPEICCPEDERFISLVKRCWSQSSLSRPTMKEVLDELSKECIELTIPVAHHSTHKLF